MTDVNGVPAYQPEPTGTPAGAPYAPAPVNENPGRTLGIVALVLAIFLNIVGAIVGIVALNKSKKAGFKNGPALAAIIVGFVIFVGWILIWVIAAIAIASSPQLQDVGNITNEILAACQGLASGTTVTVRGVDVQCP